MHRGTLVIAEAGVNHNGDTSLAKQLIDVAAAAKADYVKFQTFTAEEVSSADAPLAEYQAANLNSGGSQIEMLKKLELSREQHLILAGHCNKRGIKFLSTPFDVASLRFLNEDINVDLIKIPSGEIVNPLLLIEAGRTHKPIIMSTGMAVMNDIELALGAIAHGRLNSDLPIGEDSFKAILQSNAGRATISDRISLMHCTTEYPAAFADVNLRAIDTLKTAFGLPVGLSDHSPGISAAIAAVAIGAGIIEKHFTLDQSLPGPDHKASLTPEELHSLIKSIREVEAALGHGRKEPAAIELKNAAIARRSVAAACDIEAGTAITTSHLCFKRPGTGISPMRYLELTGRKAVRKISAGTLISQNDLE